MEMDEPQANYVLGGTAGVLATTCVQPMDLVKTRMQLRSSLCTRLIQ